MAPVRARPQEQAAESLGKAANKISRVENGRVGISKADLNELLRMLTRENPAQFIFALSESTLRRVIGGPKVMAEQLRHLAELALLPTVDIQVIPFDTLSYKPLGYDFTVLRFDHDSATDIIYIDMYDNGVYLDKPSEAVRQYVELQRRLQAIALGPVESRNFMVELAGQFAAKPDEDRG